MSGESWTGRDHHGAYRVDADGTITRETWGGYRAVSDRDPYSNHETLIAPGGDEVCTLGEPEDRTLSRDLSPIVSRLATAEAEAVSLRRRVSELEGEIARVKGRLARVLEFAQWAQACHRGRVWSSRRTGGKR